MLCFLLSSCPDGRTVHGLEYILGEDDRMIQWKRGSQIILELGIREIKAFNYNIVNISRQVTRALCFLFLKVTNRNKVSVRTPRLGCCFI